MPGSNTKAMELLFLRQGEAKLKARSVAVSSEKGHRTLLNRMALNRTEEEK